MRTLEDRVAVVTGAARSAPSPRRSAPSWRALDVVARILPGRTRLIGRALDLVTG